MAFATAGSSVALRWPLCVVLLEPLRELCEKCYAFHPEQRPAAASAQRELRNVRPEFFGDKPLGAMDFAKALRKAQSWKPEEIAAALESDQASDIAAGALFLDVVIGRGLCCLIVVPLC